MSEHTPVVVKAPIDGPAGVQIYCQGKLTAAFRDVSGEWFCACCGVKVKVAW